MEALNRWKSLRLSCIIMEIKEEEIKELTPKNVIVDLFFILFPRLVKSGNRA